MKSFLKIGMIAGVLLALTLGSYESSAKVKLKAQEETVLQVDELANVVMAHFREVITPAYPNLEEVESTVYRIDNDQMEAELSPDNPQEKLSKPRIDRDAILLSANAYWQAKTAYGDSYLHRSQAWLKMNNLQINSVVNTFGKSTEIGIPMLC